MTFGRFLLGTLFVLSSLPIGVLIGGYIGSRYFIPGGAGLANPVVALYYGAFGAVIAGIIALVLAIYLSRGWLLGVSLPVIVVGLVCALAFWTIYIKAKSKSEAHLDEAYKNLNKFQVTLTYDDSVANPPFRHMEIDWSKHGYTALERGPEGRTCKASISGKEAVAVLTALRNVGAVLLKNPDPCAGTSGAPERTLKWLIHEAKPPNTEGNLALTAACMKQHPQLAEPFNVARKIFEDGDLPKGCSKTVQ